MRISKSGYVLTGNGQAEHVLIAEAALGHALPDKAEVHHVNQNKLDNSHTNLVVCQDSAYHRLLHVRQAAFDACGNPDWRKCVRCGCYDAIDQMVLHAKGKKLPQYNHQICKRAWRTRWRRAHGRSTTRGRPPKVRTA